MTRHPFKKKATLLLVLLAIHPPLIAQNLGVFGQTYPIIEQDFQTWMQTKLKTLQQNGTLARLKTQWQQHIQSQSDRPIASTDITTTTKARTWLFDTTITLKKAITDNQGHIIAHAGERFNPLEQVSLKTPLIFFNGDNPKQITWLKQQLKTYQKNHLRAKPIAIQGSVKNLTQTLQQTIYFDQGARLSRHFKIKHVPTTITQQGLRLKIAEVPVEPLNH